MVDPADPAAPRDAQLADDSLRPAAAFLDTVLDGLADGVLACSRSGIPIVVNRAARLFYEAVVGSPWDDHTGRAWLDQLVGAATQRETARRGPGAPLRDVELTIQGVTTEHTIRLTKTPVTQIAGRPLGSVVTLHDHTHERAEELRLAREASEDPVTGLPSRHVLMRRIDAALANPATRPVALLFADVDRIRDVNDRYGYAAGDRLLRAIARDLVDAVGDEGWLGHYGSDEYVVLVTGPRTTPYTDLADRIRATVARPRRVTDEDDAPEIAVTATVGIAVSYDANGGATGLLHEADLAMRHAQAARPGGVATFASDMRSDAAERALVDAIRGGELVLHYQPKVDLVSDRIVGVEALVRWNRPGRGLVGPAEFVPLAESTGLIVELGAWVLRTACAEAARWQEEFPTTPIRLCVNASPRQFETGIADVVRGALVASGIPPETLCLEVTETAVMRDVEAARRTLTALRDLGCGVSIDDFGTGYSSLAYLRRFPVDELKIDKTFIDGLGNDAEDTALVAGIVSLAHALDLAVVAEGVETEVQLEELRRIGCEIGQGFLFARPLPGPDITSLLRGGTWLRRPGSAATPRPVDDSLENDRVVVADDAADVLMLARLSLTSAGFDVMEVSDGQAAIEAVQQVRPSCVVLDVSMPGRDGLDVCRALRADPATADCTIVMLTATDTAGDKIAAFAAGADDYIVKPFSPRDLVGRLRAANRRRQGGRGTAASS